jgi:hypothetical protein
MIPPPKWGGNSFDSLNVGGDVEADPALGKKGPKWFGSVHGLVIEVGGYHSYPITTPNKAAQLAQ